MTKVSVEGREALAAELLWESVLMSINQSVDALLPQSKGDFIQFFKVSGVKDTFGDFSGFPKNPKSHKINTEIFQVGDFFVGEWGVWVKFVNNWQVRVNFHYHIDTMEQNLSAEFVNKCPILNLNLIFKIFAQHTEASVDKNCHENQIHFYF